MADVKISQLTALASASADVAGDVLAIVDTSVPQTKKITIENLVAPITLDKSNARIGIGQSSPTTTLDVNGAVNMASTLAVADDITLANNKYYEVKDSGGSAIRLLGLDNSNNIYMGFVDDATGTGSLYLRTGGTNALTIDNSQNATFAGTITGSYSNSSGTDYLDGDAGLYLANSGSDGTMIKFGDTNAGLVYGGSGSGTFKLMQRENTAVFIDASRRVGIGTTSPGYLTELRVNDTTTDTPRLVIRQLGAGDSSLAFQMPDSPYGFTMGVDNSDSDRFKISTGVGDVGGTGEKMSIATDGMITFTNTSARWNFYTDSDTDIVQYFAGHDTSDAIRIAASIAVATTAASGACNGELIFATATGNTNTERMRITSGGFVGINRSSDIHERLTVSGMICSLGSSSTSSTAGNQRAILDLTSNACRVGHFRGSNGAGSGSTQFFVDSVYVGKFDYNGDFYSNDGTVHNLSDKRGKKDIQDLSDGLDIVKKLKPVTYKWNGKAEMSQDDDVTRYGFVADDIFEVASQYVGTTKAKLDGEDVDNYKTISMLKMFPMLVKAVQELSAKVETLENA